MSVTARGGYQIIDGNGTIFTKNVTRVIIPGIYEAALNRFNKPCYFGNLSFNYDSEEIKVPFQLVLPKLDTNNTDIVIKFKDDSDTDNTLYISANDELFAD